MMFLDREELQSHNRNYTKLTCEQFKSLYNVGQAVQLGKGSFGAVWKVTTPKGQEVAIKEFNKNAMRSFRQIIREVNNLKLLQHPNIARFYDCYIVDDSQYYIVIEYCPGGTLSSYIRSQPLSDYEKVALCKNIAEGLACAHEKKIVHRDLKPDNVLIGKGGIAKICDFGCSTSTQQSDGVLTSRIGSPAYMDRRISNGDSYDISVDIYALGMVFYSIFKGRGIYDECTSAFTMEKLRSSIQANYEERMEELMADVPTFMKNIIKNCLQPDFTRRYSACRLVDLLANELDSRSLLSKLMSTVDEEEIEDESSLFAVGLLSCYSKVDKLQNNLSTRKTLFWLLNVSKESMAKIDVLSSIKYIDPRTKEQYCVAIIFYYVFWLDRLLNLIKGLSSEFKHKYPEIVPSAVQQEVLERAEAHITAETEAYTPVLTKFSRKINNYMRLIDAKLYMPQILRKIISKLAFGISAADYNEHSDEGLKELTKNFFERRVRSQFNRNIGANQDEQSCQQLKIVEELGNNF